MERHSGEGSARSTLHCQKQDYNSLVMGVMAERSIKYVELGIG